MGVGWLWRHARPVALVAVAMLGVASMVATRSGADAGGTELDPLELRALALQATLRIDARTCEGSIRGSGFVVDETLVSNAHLVEAVAEAKVDGPIASALMSVIAVSDSIDVAMIGAPSAVGVQWADTPAAAGDPVLLAGHAGGGVTRLVEAEVATRVDGSTYGHRGDLLLVDGRTTEGFSGGPVFDRGGDVVGILTGFDRATGLSLAIPADVAAAEIDGLRARLGPDRLTWNVARSTVCG